MINNAWEQAGALLFTGWLIWGTVLASWKLGTKFFKSR